MSASSGITASDDLAAAFAGLRVTDDNDPTPPRVIKVVIDGVELVEAGRQDACGTWEEDYPALVPSLLDDTDPCYVLYRLDSRDTNGAYRWLFIDYVPDNAHVRKKMTYASTRAALRRSFGDSLIADEIHGSNKDDVSFEGYQRHLKSLAAPAPLRQDEREMAEIKKSEVGAHIAATSRHEVAGSIAFPADEAATAALEDLRDGGRHYVQLYIDTANERILLADADNHTTQTIQSGIPVDSPRYHFLAYPHEHEGEDMRPIFFIYSCPGYNCSIKERMLYSSCKNHVLQHASQVGVKPDKKLEVSDPDDVSHDILHTEIHPPVQAATKKFLKPAAPGRGPRRMHRDRSAESLNSQGSGATN